MAKDVMTNRGTAVAPTMQYRDSMGLDPGYTVTLTVTGDDTVGDGFFQVSTTLDESFSISLGSTWDTPYANVIQDTANRLAPGGRAGAAVSAATQIGQAMGYNGKSAALTAQVWQTSDSIGFSIPFTFIAQSDPAREVSDKVLNLLKLTAPSEANGIIRAPGPTIIGQLASKLDIPGRKIKLRVGKFLELDNCIIKRVDAQFDSIIGESGVPHKAKVTVDIESFFTCFTVQDLDKMFKVKGGS